MSTNFTLDKWFEIIERGTSGDQVHDILYDWKADAQRNEKRIKELEMYNSAIDQMNYDLYTMHVFVKEKMRDYDIGTRFLVKLANDWVCPATYTSKGWIDDNGNELISVTHYMVMPGVLP